MPESVLYVQTFCFLTVKPVAFFSVVVVVVQWLLEPLVLLPSKTLLDMSWDDFVEKPTIR